MIALTSCLRFLLLVFVFCGTARAAPPPTVAFYYGAAPPLADLQAFDIAVVEPDHVPDPRRYARAPTDGGHELFAYVSLGEVLSSRAYYRGLPAAALRADNPAWGSKVIDQTAPGWREYFLSQVIAPLWEKGWRGFFIDTLDSYQLFAKTDAERAAQAQALIGTLQELKRRYPQARLMLNRGFELLPALAPITYAVAAESLYRGYGGGQGYRPVPESERAWLQAQLQTVREQYHLPVIVIDYVDPNQPRARDIARTTADRIHALGFIPWVADGALSSIGIGAIELIPRKVLVLVDSPPGTNLDNTDAQRFLGMPLNYLGLSYEIIDLRLKPLPEGILAGRYAGVVTWFHAGSSLPNVWPWLKRAIRQGVRIAVLDNFGFPLDASGAGDLGLQLFQARPPEKLSIASRDQTLIGFEAEPLPASDQAQALRIADPDARSLLRLQDIRGNRYDAAALTAWGGFVLAPFVVQSIASMNQDRWVLQPLKFLRAALALPEVPVPDVTTEGGRRMLLSHIDGDGFASHAEFPGTPFTGEVVRREIMERYRLPISASVIEGEVSPQGLYRKDAPVLEALARRIFALPSVEAASHSFSHPFNWVEIVEKRRPPSTTAADSDDTYNLPLPGYQFDLTREVRGSMDYIDRRLMPVGKKAAIFFWSGDCAPPGIAVAEVYRDGYLNMNGGDTLITNSNNTWTAIAAQGVRKDGWYQVYAPNQNENEYTHEWHGPFYGYQRVIETFKLTEAPYRFKPVDIYFHFYSASKPASLAALHKVYRWALAQPLTRVYASQYIRKVLDFETTTLARDRASGDLLVRSGHDLRTLRLPPGVAPPSLRASSGVAGFAPGPSGYYLILASAEARLSAKQDADQPVYVREANGAISDLVRGGQGGVNQIRFMLTSNDAAEFTLAQARGCAVTIDGRAVAANARSRSDADGAWQHFASNAASTDGMSLTAHYAVQARCPP